MNKSTNEIAVKFEERKKCVVCSYPTVLMKKVGSLRQVNLTDLFTYKYLLNMKILISTCGWD